MTEGRPSPDNRSFNFNFDKTGSEIITSVQHDQQTGIHIHPRLLIAFHAFTSEAVLDRLDIHYDQAYYNLLGAIQTFERRDIPCLPETRHIIDVAYPLLDKARNRAQAKDQQIGAVDIAAAIIDSPDPDLQFMMGTLGVHPYVISERLS